MNSMTGFGRAEQAEAAYTCAVEIRTVNNRYNDIVLKMPHAFNALENKIRGTIQQKLRRGRIEVYVGYETLQETAKSVSFDKGLAGQYIEVLNALKEADPMISQNIDLALLAGFPGVITVTEKSADADVLWGRLEPVLNQALAQVQEARSAEGARLKKDIAFHGAQVKALLARVKETAPTAFEHSKQALRERIQKNLEDVPVDEMRLLNEIAVLADKLAVDEETARLESHLARLDELLESPEPVGRKLDFLIQEMNRETNTIGSKTDCIDISNLVIDMKSEIEKMREQVQNIE